MMISAMKSKTSAHGSVIAVSYTHLDVYKRQEEEDSHLGDFIPDDDAPAPAEAAAFSMLDVYKRQRQSCGGGCRKF